MSEQELEVLITLDDPGEDDLKRIPSTRLRAPVRINREVIRPANRSNCTATMIQIVSDRYHCAWVV